VRAGTLGALSLALRATPCWADPPPAAPPSYAPAPVTSAAPPPPVAAAAPAPPGYQPAPPGYQPPPGYPAPYWQAPETLPYRADSPIPAGYRVVEKPRMGLIITGGILIGVPYIIGLSAVSTRSYNNGANWLAIPVLGPWLALGARRSACNRSDNTDGSLACAGDVLATTGLIFDGIIQTAGGTLLVIGLAVPKKVLLRQDVAARITFAPIGSGYGIATLGTF
jgi:hypothetical protein